jgi:Zn ribbon nucleic-acid-binding protein
MTNTARMDCPRCDDTTDGRLIYRDHTEDSDVEVWECVACGWREQL